MRRLPPMAVVPLAVALVLVLGTCDDQPTIPLPDSSSGEISDAFHGEAGNPHFMWLAPMVSQPESFNGAFDGDSDPVVTVCELTDTGCTLLLHGSTGAEAVYTVSGGPGGVVVQVDPVEEHFLVTWHTDEFNTAVGPTYRVQVALGSTLLGLADLTLTETGKEVTKKNEITGESETIALKDGRTLPVTFRIEEGAICSNPTQPCTTATVDAGEEKTVTLTDDGGEVFSEVRFPSGWAATDENGDPVEALTLTMEKRPVFPTEDPDDPSCLAVVKVNDPVTGEPENCVELRLDTDTEFDVRVDFVRTGDGFLPVLTFCPDEDVLASPNLDRYVMTSVEEDVADPAIQNRRTYAGAVGLDCTSSETIGFGGGSSEGLLALGTRLLGSVAALLLPEELWAIDIGFGGELDGCCTIFFFAIDKEAEVVTAPTVTEAAVGADLGTVEVEVRSTHPTVQPLPGEELTFSFMRPELPVGTFDQPTVVTDANGIAAHNWTLGTAGGRNTLFIFGAASDTARLEVLGLGRVSLWKGDGDNNDAVGQNHGVRTNPDPEEAIQEDPFATGIVGQAFNFDGTGDVVSFPGRNIRTATDLTVATWVNLDPDGPGDEIQRFVTLGGERAVLRQNNPPEGGARQLHFFMNIDDEGDGFDEDGSDLHHITLDNALATGCWHHVAGTYDGTTMRLYLDGTEVPTSVTVSGTQVDAGGVRLSHEADDNDGVLNSEALWGRLDEVEVHNVALTAEEIGDIWTGTSSAEKCEQVVPDEPASVTVSPENPSILATEAVQLTAEVRDGFGNLTTDQSVEWTSSNTSVATVDAEGLVTGVSAGTVTIAAAATSGTASGSTTVTVQQPFTAATVAAGNWHTCALASGEAFCWGNNASGQLGDGSSSDALVPTRVLRPADVSFTSPVTAWGDVSDGVNDRAHTCVRTSAPNTMVYCWGENGAGEVGDGTNTNRSTPVFVMEELLGAVTAGSRHTCVSQPSHCWGLNGSGQLGDGTTTSSNVPVAVTGEFSSSIRRISAGERHTCATLASTGEAVCWGANDDGQLGTGETGTLSTAPVAVSGGLGFVDLDAGEFHTCGVTLEGAMYCWGRNDAGQIGTGATSPAEALPTQVQDPASGPVTWTSVSAGALHTCGLSDAGQIYCWGANHSGQLGTGNLSDSHIPVEVSGTLTWASISAGGGHTCAVTDDQSVYCWGRNHRGQLGDGTTETRTTPGPVIQPVS